LENNMLQKNGEYRLYQGRVADQLDTDPYYGFHLTSTGWVYRVQIPEVSPVFLTGEFNNWNRTGDPMLSLENGNWVVYLCGGDRLWPECRVETIVIP